MRQNVKFYYWKYGPGEKYLMIKIRVGEMEPDDGAIDTIFRGNYEDEWFDDPFVKDLVMEIDNSEVAGPYLIISIVMKKYIPLKLVVSFMN